MIRLKQDVIHNKNELFKEFKVALTEQYVLQQLKKLKELNIYYWIANKGGVEIDFIIDKGNQVIHYQKSVGLVSFSQFHYTVKTK